MRFTKKQLKEHVAYWRFGAERDRKIARDLFKAKHYDACLFFCCLMTEKMLKGVATERIGQPPPYTHNLERLATLAKLNVNQKQKRLLKIVAGFNIAGRYDDIKRKFHKKCTRAFGGQHLKASEELYLWLKNQYQKK